MIVRQDIITWYTPEEKMPPEGECVVATVSGCSNNATYDHALCMVSLWDGGFVLEDLELDDFKIHAWCDLEPYKG